MYFNQELATIYLLQNSVLNKTKNVFTFFISFEHLSAVSYHIIFIIVLYVKNIWNSL